MVRKRQKIMVMIVVIIMTVAGLAIILIGQKPEPSLAEKMILKPSDLGTEWGGYYQYYYQSYGARPVKNESCHSNWVLGNSTFEVWVWLAVFNSTDDCNRTFQEESMKILADSNLSSNYRVVQIGDHGFSWESNFANTSYGYHGYPGLVFQKDNVICSFWISPWNYHPWMADGLSDLAAIQLTKIERNSS